ncbi:unnamed protein product [Adineta steineri]|uniref:Uncharacterized protein n=1 Tax=Adineta steineri TaxID=433720 RepID=A0A814H4U3_9BILA|nr:unnamed protein product [Adineta steineri]CAF3619171.1 unnamed protein product [Adineta steineri]
MISQKQLDCINELSSKFTEYNKGSLGFDVKDAIEQAISKKSISGTKQGLENVMSTINKNVANQLERILWATIVKSAFQTYKTYMSVQETCALIEQSKQYRESLELQSAINTIKEYLDKFKNFYQDADKKINDIEKNSGHTIDELTLERITNKLEKAKGQCDSATEKLTNILHGIREKSQLLSSSQKKHYTNLGLSFLNIVVTGIEYIMTPASALTSNAQLFFAGTGACQLADVVGHYRGYFWTKEEIEKLDQWEREINELDRITQKTFKKIDDVTEKLEKIKKLH